MAQCVGCGQSSPQISQTLGLCVECLRGGGERWREHVLAVHAEVRARFDLPPTSQVQAATCLAAAKKAGLTNVQLGNPWLLP